MSLRVRVATFALVLSGRSFADGTLWPVRGITIGPIENAYHPGVGYGSAAFADQVRRCASAGATWLALTPFGRVANLKGRGVDPTFEASLSQNENDVGRAIDIAHGYGLRVMLVPHLWVESGEWRAKIDPGTDEGWAHWAASYSHFVRGWAEVAERHGADLFSSGVELRSWVTTTRAPSFVRVIRDVRKVYHGQVTYSGNWDDVRDTVILGELDAIGINAFYPLAGHAGAAPSELLAGAETVRQALVTLAKAWRKPVFFSEMGYATRQDPALRPWEWPEDLKNVVVDTKAQSLAYAALLAPLVDEPAFGGFFVWRVYSDPFDVSQEPEWGFSPQGKAAEHVLRSAFSARWAQERR